MPSQRIASRPYTVIPPAHPLPDDLTKGHALIALYALQQWESFSSQYPVAIDAGYFTKNIVSVLNGLNNTSRTTLFKHLDERACIACAALIDLHHSTLDHIIPLHDGGTQAPQNTLMLCRHCNSSKGTKDLLDWWTTKAYPATDLPRRALCLYARIHWQQYGLSVLDESATEFLRSFLADRAHALPSDTHRITLIGAAYAGATYARWLLHEV